MVHCVHSACMQRVRLCVCVCACYETLELLSAFRPHLNPSILQLEADEGAQGKSSPHVSLLYLHSLAVFVSYISSNERKIKKINNTLCVSFYTLVPLLAAVFVLQVSKIPHCQQQSIHLFTIYRSFFSFIESLC